ncbi:MAG: helix-turn-helix transcriptional regulator [Eubacteriales bacterium]|nr:helix-turn-helix transcriptional regulator [Eubacteriales bacterium]
MQNRFFPVVDVPATGRNSQRLRQARGLTVRDVQAYFGFEKPQAIYKWQSGKSLPSVDNLYALSSLLEVPMEDILVQTVHKLNIATFEQRENPGCSDAFYRLYLVSDDSLFNVGRFPIPIQFRYVS